MSEIQAKIDALEAEMARTQKNKATNYHLGTLKAKIAKLKSELINGPGGKSAGTKNAERGFDVSKSGDTRIGLVGFPSVGKSTLLTTLTGTRSEAAAYEFTTLTCIPGTMKYKGARIQVLDLPGIIEGAADGKGRGRQVISTARTCNMILIVLDAAKPLTHKKIIEQELHSFGIRINQEPARVKFIKKVRKRKMMKVYVEIVPWCAFRGGLGRSSRECHFGIERLYYFDEALTRRLHVPIHRIKAALAIKNCVTRPRV